MHETQRTDLLVIVVEHFARYFSSDRFSAAGKKGRRNAPFDEDITRTYLLISSLVDTSTAELFMAVFTIGNGDAAIAIAEQCLTLLANRQANDPVKVRIFRWAEPAKGHDA